MHRSDRLASRHRNQSAANCGIRTGPAMAAIPFGPRRNVGASPSVGTASSKSFVLPMILHGLWFRVHQSVFLFNSDFRTNKEKGPAGPTAKTCRHTGNSRSLPVVCISDSNHTPAGLEPATAAIADHLAQVKAWINHSLGNNASSLTGGCCAFAARILAPTTAPIAHPATSVGLKTFEPPENCDRGSR